MPFSVKEKTALALWTGSLMITS